MWRRIARIIDDDLWTSDHLKSLLFFARKNNCNLFQVPTLNIDIKKIHQNQNFRPRIGEDPA